MLGRVLAASAVNASGSGDCASGCTEAMCTILGVVIHVFGSVGINIGQNLQAMAIADHPQGKDSKTWKVGMALFAVASVITFSALALASATILVPLESVQFVVNIAFNGIVRKKRITITMYVGTAVIIGGVVLVVLFGTNEEAQSAACYTEDQLKHYWTEPAWWIYLIISFGIAGVSYIIWRIYERNAREGAEPLPGAKWVEPVTFTLSSALFGGGQMVVHTKLIAELLELSFASVRRGSSRPPAADGRRGRPEHSPLARLHATRHASPTSLDPHVCVSRLPSRVSRATLPLRTGFSGSSWSSCSCLGSIGCTA